jgi:hypothetical protein
MAKPNSATFLKRILSAVAFSALMFATACTDVIEVELNPAEGMLVVDAWLNDKPDSQVIRLTRSLPYFGNVFSEGMTSASVTVTSSSGDTFIFEDQGNGDYIWSPDPGGTLGVVGTQYVLEIEWNGASYIAHSEMRRVPAIDSIQIEFRTDELGFADGHYAIMFARDFPGTGDTYWIKAYKNGVFLNKPQELNIAYDASFDAGGGVDGIVFILPIRELINRFPDPDTGDDFDVPPYAPGDEVHVEIHSITTEAFLFLETARDQMVNGDNTIFSIPLANTRSNVLRAGDQEPVLGFFCVSAVSESTRVVD